MNTTAKIGAFFLVVLLLSVALVLKIEQLPIGKRALGSRYEVVFDDVAGLDDKSSVRVAGVRVGKVDGIQLLPDGRAVVNIVITGELELREGAMGEIKALGLLGEKFVEVHPGKPGSAVLADGTRIRGGGSTGMDELTSMAADIGRDIKELTSALRGSLGGKTGEEKINRIVNNVGALAEELRHLVASNRQNVDATTANLAAFSADIRETLKRIDRILDENRTSVKGSVSNVEEVSAKLKEASEDLKSITAKIDHGDGTLAKLLNEDTTHRNLNDTLESVRSGVDELKKAVAPVNKIDVELGFRGDLATRGENGRGFFGVDLKPQGKPRFYRLELGALEGGRRRFDRETTTVTLPDGTPVTTEKSVERFEDEIVVNAQVGYRFKDTVLRAGMFESRGGAGIDQKLLADRLTLTAEAWDFTRQNELRAQLRLFGEWRLTPNLFVGAGVTDTLNPGRRSMVLGGAIRWKDDDAKALIGLAGLAK